MLNNRTRKKWFITLTLLLWLGVVWQPRSMAGSSITEFSARPAHRNGLDTLSQPNGIRLADNHSTQEQTGKTGSSDHGAAEEKTVTGNKNKTKKEDKKTKPLKSFVPTEKVKADQAVDFPYDI